MKDTTIVLPGQIEPFTDTFMLALAIYREARGEDLTGKIAADCVIRNRVQHPSWYGRNWFDVITKPYQFDGLMAVEVARGNPVGYTAAMNSKLFLVPLLAALVLPVASFAQTTPVIALQNL